MEVVVQDGVGYLRVSIPSIRNVVGKRARARARALGFLVSCVKALMRITEQLPFELFIL